MIPIEQIASMITSDPNVIHENVDDPFKTFSTKARHVFDIKLAQLGLTRGDANQWVKDFSEDLKSPYYRSPIQFTKIALRWMMRDPSIILKDLTAEKQLLVDYIKDWQKRNKRRRVGGWWEDLKRKLGNSAYDFDTVIKAISGRRGD